MVTCLNRPSTSQHLNKRCAYATPSPKGRGSICRSSHNSWYKVSGRTPWVSGINPYLLGLSNVCRSFRLGRRGIACIGSCNKQLSSRNWVTFGRTNFRTEVFRPHSAIYSNYSA